MEMLEKIVDEIGIENAVKQVEGFFLFLEEKRREKTLKQSREILLEQKALRYRWRERNT